MSGEYQLKNGLETDWIQHDSTWKKGVDRNWKNIDWALYKTITDVVNASTDLPGTSSDGDSYLVQTDNQVYVWNQQTTQFDKFDLTGPFIFYDLSLSNWYQWVSGIISLFSSGGSAGDVLGPGGSVDENIAVFDGTTGKLIKDGGMSIADILALSGTGTVTSVSVVTANGVSGSVATATTTPAITLTLGAITPSSVAASGAVSGSNLSGTNTGDQTITLTGDATGSGTSSFAVTIPNNTITYAKFQDITTNKLLGRATAGSGDMEEITLGTGLSFSGTTLNVSGFGTGTVTSVSVSGSNGIGVSGSPITTSGTIVLSLGAITPTSVAASGSVSGSNLSGTNTGDQTITLTGDATGSGTGSFATTLATVNSNVGSFGSATQVAAFTVNAKGLTTAASNISIQIAESQVTNLVSDLASKASSTLTNAHIFVGNGSNVATDVAVSGDLTLANTGAFTFNTVNSNVGSFGSATQVGTFTVNAKGLITGAGNTTITPAASSITGGAALSKTDDTNVTLTLGGSPTSALLVATSLTLGWTGTLADSRLSTTAVTAASYGSATQVGTFTVSATGRLTAASNVTITPAASSITGGAALTKTDDTNVTLTLGGSPTSALLAASSITVGWTGTLSGTRGGTGVNNGSSTITIAGNVTHAGSFTQTFTATANTSLTLPTTGTLATLAGTETFTNKTIGVTQLNGSAFTMAVNNTNATANYTEITYQDAGSQTYAGTITWTGTTAPSGTLTKNYYWRQIGKEVKLDIALKYTVAGAALTAVTLTLPSDAPTPVEWNGFGAANEKIWTGYGYIDTAATGGAPATRVVLGVNATDTGYLINAAFGSQSALVAMVTVIYRTT